MRKTSIALTLVAIVALAACGKKPEPYPPAPVVPEAPPLAPEPDVVAQEDEYTRIKAMSSDEIDRLGLLQAVHFDFDRYDIRESERSILEKNAQTLKKLDFLVVKVEGHCDERGTVEYNIALGERRARAAHDYLVSLGVSAARLRTVSFGKEVPLCADSTEDCWARNRRAHFKVTGKAN
ncbi:MAG: peptidoglycan-associated lipoprotein Pal [Vicinamibacteria bacterium]|nr:peptidoglycan-associated lipoprotein Pal [Vicinamibacteria bacterium]